MIDKERAYKLGDSNVVLLPIGLYDPKTGTYTREVVVDEWRGADHERLSSPMAKKNPARAMSAIIARLLQQIKDGDHVVLDKQNKLAQCDSRHVDNMFQADRDMILLISLIAAGDNIQRLDYDCPACGAGMEEDVDLCELDVYPHNQDLPPEIKFELPRGLVDEEGNVFKHATFTFPTGKVYQWASKFHSQGAHAFASALISKTVSLEGMGLLDMKTVRSMGKRDRDAIIKALGEAIPGVDLNVELYCDECGEEFTGQVDVSAFFR